ncbi:LysR family transcriptional regulator YafC [Klebsiella pneumoniae IS46]|uniref:LysR family transcriptional regulator YafC n=1 Tax=Klebsiella pneumoniae IS43 TaxID=1432552 RepID=W1DSW8_KLEPN|nr:LysR family transcriptional regulator YafC [Klebsiella pneumoniae IS43]CDL16614.1 LysR family transcriptional regulator YafC [Klebsiella pneumoniae IS46]CDL64966.1 LysR family transcriptional regulator YafC [Klebsiella pneumoniae IS39]
MAVVESGSFSRAAEQLGQANSAVSRAVKKLESKLGVSCSIGPPASSA